MEIGFEQSEVVEVVSVTIDSTSTITAGEDQQLQAQGRKRPGRKCIHGKIRCKDCGTSIRSCMHGKERYRCRECGGGGICDHGKIKSICKDCGGSSVCPHGKLKYRCEDCDGISVRKKRNKLLQSSKRDRIGINSHERVLKESKDGPGAVSRAVCQHGKIRCKECGSAIRSCPHGKERYRCRDCGGGGICQHNRIRSVCRDCGGSSICYHGRDKYKCKDCQVMGSILSSKLCRSSDTSMTPYREMDGSTNSVSDVTSNEDDADGTATDNTGDLS